MKCLISRKIQIMNKFNTLTLIFLSLLLLNSCGTVKDGFQNSKKNNSDEFLVEKKSPLVMPPEFDKLPIPNETTEDESVKKNNLKELIADNEEKVENNTSNMKLEEALLEKIKNN